MDEGPPKKTNEITRKASLAWIRVFLTLIPLAITCTALYWTVLTASQIFVKAVTPLCCVIGSFMAASSFVSGALAIPALKRYNEKQYNTIFHIYLISTIIGLIFAGGILIATNVQSQSIYELMIELYITYNPNDSVVRRFNTDRITQFDKLTFFFQIGQNSFEIMIVLSVFWILSIIANFTMIEYFARGNIEDNIVKSEESVYELGIAPTKLNTPLVPDTQDQKNEKSKEDTT